MYKFYVTYKWQNCIQYTDVPNCEGIYSTLKPTGCNTKPCKYNIIIYVFAFVFYYQYDCKSSSIMWLQTVAQWYVRIVFYSRASQEYVKFSDDLYYKCYITLSICCNHIPYFYAFINSWYIHKTLYCSALQTKALLQS